MQKIPEAHPETSGFDRDRHTARYGYNARNEMIERNQHFGGVAWLQSIDYSYNDQGWLTVMNQASLGGTNIAFPTCTTSVVNPGTTTTGQADDTKDLFYMQLQYDVLHSGLAGTLRKDGNISQALWRVRGRERQAYSFGYDGLQRITSASYSDINDAGTVSATNRYNTSYTYADLRGNISNNQRNGLYLSGACYTQALLDNMTYSYAAGTNKISSISDAASATQGGFRAASGAMTYDNNGNMISNAAKGITSISYNHLNLPTNITITGSKTIDFTYSADGNKLRKVVKTGATINLVQEYINGIEYRGTAIPANTIEAAYHAEGRVYNSAGSWKREYTIKDHLGNTRLAYCDLDNNGVVATPSEILQENHTDAFGYDLGGVYMNHTNSDNLYQYNGKEKNDDHGIGMYDYGARFMDPSIGRFVSIDRFSEKYANFTPYQYGGNNPIRYIDINGDSLSTNFSNALSEQAFKAFIGTKSGYKYLSKYAAAGQNLFGYKFSKDGSRHKKGQDLIYTSNYNGKANADTKAKIIENRLKINVDLNPNPQDDSFFDRAKTTIHETYLYVEEYSKDYEDNLKMDYCIKGYDALINVQPKSKHHLFYHDKPGEYLTHPLTVLGQSSLREIADKNGIIISNENIFKKIWNFSN